MRLVASVHTQVTEMAPKSSHYLNRKSSYTDKTLSGSYSLPSYFSHSVCQSVFLSLEEVD